MAEDDIGALWIRQGKSGNKFLSGYITINGVKTQIVGFKNDYATTENKQPYYKLKLGKDQTAAPPPDEDSELKPF